MAKNDNNWCALVGLLCVFLGSGIVFGMTGIGVVLAIFGVMVFCGAAMDGKNDG